MDVVEYIGERGASVNKRAKSILHKQPYSLSREWKVRGDKHPEHQNNTPKYCRTPQTINNTSTALKFKYTWVICRLICKSMKSLVAQY